MNRKRYLRICLFVLLMTGAFILVQLNEQKLSHLPLIARIGISFAFAAIIFFILIFFAKIFRQHISQVDVLNLIVCLSCLLIGLIISALFSVAVSALPGYAGTYGPLLITALNVFLIGLIGQSKIDVLRAYINKITNGRFQVSEAAAVPEKIVLMDTSVIIDGRIADIARTGFVPGILVAPNFVLSELQYIADSEDAQRRQRGRRGLDILAELQKDENVHLRIEEFDIPNVREVDAKLVSLAQELECPILTNDYNLNKVADLQGVRILNVNDLANAVKSIMLPGEKLRLLVIQEGKEQNQGVGYLEDGTMVVVENGHLFISREIDVVVTKVLQTAAGRMIFARHDKDLGVKR